MLKLSEFGKEESLEALAFLRNVVYTSTLHTGPYYLLRLELMIPFH